MFDTCDQAMFVKEHLLSDLGVQGRRTSMAVQTMNREVTKPSKTLEDLEMVQASNGKAERVWVKMPCTHIKEDLLLGSQKGATIDKIKRLGYLDKIKVEVNASANM